MITRRPLPFVLLSTLLLAGPASAQSAIGDGRALDANPSPYSGGFNTPVDEIDYRARNNIVTNNVVGGRGFRGSVGYSAEDAFRGSTGSDEFYDFRADSAWSGVNLVNFNTTYQRFRYGQDAAIVQFSRVGQGFTSGSFSGGYQPAQVNEALTRLDQLSFSTLTATAEESRVQPSVVGNMYDGEGNAYVIQASSLGGLARTPVNQVSELIGLTSYDFARVAAEDAEGRSIGTAYKGTYKALLASSRVDSAPGKTLLNPLRLGDPIEEEIETETKPGVEDQRVTGDQELLAIREHVAERLAQLRLNGVITSDARTELDAKAIEEVEEHLRLLRIYLTGSAAKPGEGTNPDDATLPGARIGLKTGTDLPQVTQEEMDALDPDLAKSANADDSLIGDRPVGDYGMVLRHGEQIDRLTSGEGNTRFNELLISAEEALREGRYFWAERRFSRALRFTPGHPLATTGLVHTQIGAGLYLSASLTLRSLYVHQPEMIDARFAPSLLPNRPRLLDAIETLGGRLSDKRDRSNTALLYAYIGRLLNEQKTVERGLAVLSEDSPNDPLVPLLRSIWLVPDAPQK